jgi:preprotein translocase subunit YajC
MIFLLERFFMSLFNVAHATTSAGTNSSEMNFMSFLPMIIIFVLFWLLLIRPQQKKAKLHNQMLSTLEKGDEVLTTSGLIGKIIKTDDNIVELEIADNVVVKLQKASVTGKLNK